MPTPEEIRNMEHRHETLSYNKISEFIYAGNNMCCQTHFEKELLTKGITADISLELERLDNPKGVSYFFWFPWEEDKAPTEELISLASRLLDNLIEKKIKTYIHCKNGHGRTTTFLAAYFMHSLKVSAAKALALIKELRPSMHINEIQTAFLENFEKTLDK